MLKNKDYCDYETSRELKELGFVAGLGEDDCGHCLYDDAWHDQVDRPLLYEAQKWMREENGIFVHVDVPWKTDYGLGWSYYCCNRPMSEEDKEVCFASGEFYDSYEEALSEGIKVAVKILKDE